MEMQYDLFDGWVSAGGRKVRTRAKSTQLTKKEREIFERTKKHYPTFFRHQLSVSHLLISPQAIRR